MARLRVIQLTFTSDIASYYKEELAGELNTYIRDRAAASGKSTGEVLNDLVDETVAAYQRIERILHGRQENNGWHRFAIGYFYFHVHSDRYRLQELQLF